MICLKCLKPLSQESHHYGLHASCFIQWFKVPENTIFTDLARHQSSASETINDEVPENSSFFHGKFKKYSAILGKRSYILKMRQADAPELPEVEYLCNQIADLLDINVAKYYLINFEGERVFVTKNFITQNAAPVDLQHIAHFRSPDQHTCRDLISIIKKQTKTPLDIDYFLNMILFDSIIGNHDRHGKNLGFLVSAHKIRLAPIYDNVSYLSLESGNMLKADFNPKGKIATSLTDEPTTKDYVRELRKLGYESIINDFHRKLSEKKIIDLINHSFCSVLMKQALINLILKRLREFQNESTD